MDESAIVVERVNGEQVTQATLMRLAISAILSKKASAQFDETVSGLQIETWAFEGEEKDSADGEEGRG